MPKIAIILENIFCIFWRSIDYGIFVLNYFLLHSQIYSDTLWQVQASLTMAVNAVLAPVLTALQTFTSPVHLYYDSRDIRFIC